MRAALSKFICKTGLNTMIGGPYRGLGTVFMLHSVVDDVSRYAQQPIRCSATTLERTLVWLKANDFDFIAMDDVIDRLLRPMPRRFAVFTFDDGYRDNLTVAAPVLRRFNAPLTIYVPTDMIERSSYAWWLGLAPLVLGRDSVAVEAMNCRLQTRTLAEKRSAMANISRWVKSDDLRARQLDTTFAAYGIDVEALADTEAMSAAELRIAAQDPLITIGGHTSTHCAMTQVTDHQLAKEITANKAFIEARTNKRARHFAYPYGMAGVREANAVRAAGYETAVTTKNGMIFAAHATDALAMALPREPIDDQDTDACTDCRTRGIFRFLKSRAGRPVATFQETR